jgi:hypothetical protein
VGWLLAYAPGVICCIDNYCTHKRNQDWLANYDGRVQFHFTPTSASWLNQFEIFCSIFERRTLRGASFKSEDQLRAAIQAYLALHNQRVANSAIQFLIYAIKH